jgi:uncharacterized protein YodC (DUF2158 family)
VAVNPAGLSKWFNDHQVYLINNIKTFQNNIIMAKFKIGDVVTLTSGESKMTIIGVYDKDSGNIESNMAHEAYSVRFGGDPLPYYGCSWFEKDTKKEDVFPENALKLV